MGLAAIIDFAEQGKVDPRYVNSCVGAKKLIQGTRIDDDIQRVLLNIQPAA